MAMNVKYAVGLYEVYNDAPVGPSWIYADDNLNTVKDFCKKFLKSKGNITEIKNRKPIRNFNRTVLTVFIFAKPTERASIYDAYFVDGERYKPYGTMELVSDNGVKKYVWCSKKTKKVTFYKY